MVKSEAATQSGKPWLLLSDLSVTMDVRPWSKWKSMQRLETASLLNSVRMGCPSTPQLSVAKLLCKVPLNKVPLTLAPAWRQASEFTRKFHRWSTCNQLQRNSTKNNACVRHGWRLNYFMLVSTSCDTTISRCIAMHSWKTSGPERHALKETIQYRRPPFRGHRLLQRKLRQLLCNGWNMMKRLERRGNWVLDLFSQQVLFLAHDMLGYVLARTAVLACIKYQAWHATTLEFPNFSYWRVDQRIGLDNPHPGEIEQLFVLHKAIML